MELQVYKYNDNVWTSTWIKDKFIQTYTCI